MEIPKYPSPETSLTPEGQLGPMGPGEIFRKALEIYARNARKMWLAVAVSVIPAQLLQLVIKSIAVPSAAYVHNGKVLIPPGFGSYITATAITTVIVELVQLVSLGALIRIVLDDLDGEKTPLREALGLALDRTLGMFWVFVLVAVTCVIGFFFLVIPGLYFFVGLYLAVTIVVAEDIRGTKAMRRSFDLVRERWWATFGRILLPGLVAAIPLLLLLLLAGPAIVKALNDSSTFTVFLITAVLGTLSSFLVVPFTSAFTTLIYVDLRARKEGPLDPRELVTY
jgi:hypothetical protein